VFWDIFSARTKKPASENAKAYVEKQKDRSTYPMSGGGRSRGSSIGVPMRQMGAQNPMVGMPYMNTAAQGGPINVPSPQASTVTRDPALSNPVAPGTNTPVTNGPSPQPGTMPNLISNVTAPLGIPGVGNFSGSTPGRSRPIVPPGYPNQVNNTAPYVTDRDNMRIPRGQMMAQNGATTTPPGGRGQNMYDTQPSPQPQGAPAIPNGSPSSAMPNDQLYNQDRSRRYQLPNSAAYFSAGGSYKMAREGSYPRPNDPNNPPSEDINERRPYPVANVPQHGMPPTMQPTMSPVLPTQGKDQNDPNNTNTTPNMGYSVPMNNPIPNPLNTANNAQASVANRSGGNFESEQLYNTEDMTRNDMHYNMYGDKMRVNKRSRPPSSVPPTGSHPLPYGAKVVSRRRSPGAFPLQTGTSVSQSPQGTSQTQSTPPNHSTPPQNHSPNETLPMSSASMHTKQNYNPNSVYYPAGKNPSFNPAYGSVNATSAGQAIPANYGMPYNGQAQSVNYSDPQQTGNPNYVPNSNYTFVQTMKGHGGGYMVQKYAHPGGNRFMSGLIPKNKTQYLNKLNSMNHEGEGSDNMNMVNNERDSNLAMGVENSMLTNDPYRGIDSDPLSSYPEQSLNSEGSMDIF
jgi:hypothetical protein